MQSTSNEILGKEREQDAERFCRLILTLEKVRSEIEKINQNGLRDLEGIFITLMPLLIKAFSAEHGFLFEYFDKDAVIKPLCFYPSRTEVWDILQPTVSFKKIIHEGKTKPYQSLEQVYPSPLVEPDILQIRAALLSPFTISNRIWIIGLCNNLADSKEFLFRGSDRMALSTILELILLGIRTGEKHQLKMKRIHEVASQLSAEYDLETLLPSIAKKAAQAFEADASSLMQWDDMQENLIIKASYSLSKEYQDKMTIPRDRVISTFNAIAPEQSLIINDLNNHPYGNLELVIGEGIRSILSTQLVKDHEIIGVLNIYEKEEIKEFSENDKELAELFAHQVAIAIRNASRRKQVITGILSTSKILEAQFDRQSILNLIVKTAQEIFQASAVSLFLWAENLEYMTIGSQTGLSETYCLQQRLPREKAIESVTINGSYKPKPFDLNQVPYGNVKLNLSEELLTGLGVPIVRAGELKGILVLYSKEKPRQFTFLDIELAEIFANQTATAIELTELHNQTKKSKEDAETRLTEMKNLQEAGERINGLQALHFKEYMDIIAKEICQLAGADSSVIYPYNLENNYYEIGKIGSFGLKYPRYGFRAKSRDEERSMTRRVMQARMTIVVDDVSECWDRDRVIEIKEYKKVGKFLEREGVGAFIGIGLWVANEAIGTLFLNFHKTHMFTQEEIRRIEILSNQVAIAIQNSRVIKHAEKDHKLIAAIQKLTRQIASGTQINDIWNILLKESVEIAEVQRGCVFVKINDNTDFMEVASVGYSDEGQKGHSHRLFDLLFDKDHEKFEGKLITDTRENPRSEEFSKLHYPIGSLISASSWNTESNYPIGIIILEYPEPGAFETYDKGLLEEMAVFGKIAVQGAAAYQETLRNNFLQESLVEAGQKIFKYDSEKVLHYIAERIKDILKSDVVVLFTYDESKKRIEVPIYWGNLLQPEAAQKPGTISKLSTPYKMLEYGKPYYSEDVWNDLEMNQGGFIKREKILSSAVIPLLVGKERIGILFVNFRKPHLFPNSEQKIIELFAQQAALAIHNARLYDELRLRKRHLEAVHKAGTEIVSNIEMDIEITFEKILEQAVEIVTAALGRKATLGTLHLKEGEDLVFKSVYPASVVSQLKAVIGDRIPLDPKKTKDGKIGVSGKAVVDKENKRINDVNRFPDYIAFSQNTKSELAVLMLERGQIVGVLNVELDQLNGFDRYDELALVSLADLAVVSLRLAGRMNEARVDHPDQILEESTQRLFTGEKPNFPPGMTDEIISKILSSDDLPVSPDLINHLICKAFPEENNVHLETIQGRAVRTTNVYHSRSVVLKAWLRESRQPLIIKLAHEAKINQEYTNFKKHIDNNLRRGFYAVIKRMPYSYLGLGSLVYEFMGTDIINTLPTFTNHYIKEKSPEKIIKPIQHLINTVWKDLYTDSRSELTGSLFDAYNRYMHLESRIPDLAQLEKTVHFQGINLDFNNPILWTFNQSKYSDLPRKWQAITHGDLHGDNIFTDGEHAWVIDFERSGSGPILRDFVELEVDLVTRLAEVCEENYLGLYELCVCLTEPSTPGSHLKTTANINGNEKICKALLVIDGIRQMANQVTNYSDFREYLWGLLADSIYVAFINLDKRKPQQEKALLFGSIISLRLECWGQEWPKKSMFPISFITDIK